MATLALPKTLRDRLSPLLLKQLTTQYEALRVHCGGATISVDQMQTHVSSVLTLNADQEARVMAELPKVPQRQRGSVSFVLFVRILLNADVIEGATPPRGRALTSGRRPSLVGATGRRVYNASETAGFSEFINEQLSDDQDLSDALPLDPKSKDLFEAVKEGILLPKLMHAEFKEDVDLSKLNKKPRNPFQVFGNHNVMLAAAKRIGVNVVNIGAEDMAEGTPHLVLGITWQVIKLMLMAQVQRNLAQLTIREADKAVRSVPPEQILLRWVNYHLSNAGVKEMATSLTKGISDSHRYLTILNQVAPAVVTDSDVAAAMAKSDLRARAETMLECAGRLGCRKFVSPDDVVSESARLNFAFVATLFNQFPSMGPTPAQLSQQLKETKQTLEAERSVHDALQAEHDEARAELDQLQADDAALEAKSKAELQALEEQRQQLTLQVAELEAKLDADRKQQSEHLQSLDNSLRDLTAKHDLLVTEEAEAREQVASLEAKVTALQDERATLEADQARLNEELAQLQAESQALQRRIKEDLEQQLTAKLGEAAASKRALEEELTRTTDETQRLCTQTQALQEEQAQCDAENADLQERSEQLQQRLQELNERESKLHEEGEQLRAQLETATEERAATARDLSTTEAFLADMKDLAHLDVKLGEQVGDLGTALDSLTSTMDAADSCALNFCHAYNEFIPAAEPETERQASAEGQLELEAVIADSAAYPSDGYVATEGEGAVEDADAATAGEDGDVNGEGVGEATSAGGDGDAAIDSHAGGGETSDGNPVAEAKGDDDSTAHGDDDATADDAEGAGNAVSVDGEEALVPQDDPNANVPAVDVDEASVQAAIDAALAGVPASAADDTVTSMRSRRRALEAELLRIQEGIDDAVASAASIWEMDQRNQIAMQALLHKFVHSRDAAYETEHSLLESIALSRCEFREEEERMQAIESELTQTLEQEATALKQCSDDLAQRKEEFARTKAQEDTEAAELQAEIAELHRLVAKLKQRMCDVKEVAERETAEELERLETSKREALAKAAADQAEALSKVSNLLQGAQRAGWMWRQGQGLFKKWSRRWAELRDNLLALFKDEKAAQSSNPLLVLHVEQYRIYEEEDLDKHGRARIKATCEANDSVEHLAFEDEASKVEWLKLIKTAKKRKITAMAASKSKAQFVNRDVPGVSMAPPSSTGHTLSPRLADQPLGSEHQPNRTLSPSEASAAAAKSVPPATDDAPATATSDPDGGGEASPSPSATASSGMVIGGSRARAKPAGVKIVPAGKDDVEDEDESSSSSSSGVDVMRASGVGKVLTPDAIRRKMTAMQGGKKALLKKATSSSGANEDEDAEEEDDDEDQEDEVQDTTTQPSATDVVPEDDPEVVAFRQRAPTDGPVRVLGFDANDDDDAPNAATDPVLAALAGRRESGYEW